MPALVDANVWLPILFARHPHHRAATAWWDVQAAHSCCWNRPVQQTVLRLLTNPTIMGVDTHSPDEAWLAWEKLAFDERCSHLLLEPPELEVTWRKHIAGRAASPKLWMDAFLAAWAQSANLAFVTFDSGFKSYRIKQLQLLSPEGGSRRQ